MENWPKITVVTPSFNQASFIERTLLSVLNQSYPNLEYIVIDGGSTDGTVDIIKQYENKLSYWISEKDGGQYEAIQKGFQQSTGSIMTWLNSDDMLSHKSLFTIADIFLRYPQIEWITGQTSHIDEEDRIVGYGESRRWSAVDIKYGFKKWIQQEGTFWRESLWSKAGSALNLHYEYAGDFELWSRFFQHTLLYSVNGITGFFRRRRNDQRSLDMYHAYEQETIVIASTMALQPEEISVGKAKLEYRRKKFCGTIRNRLKYKEEPEINLGGMLLFDPLEQHFVLEEKI